MLYFRVFEDRLIVFDFVKLKIIFFRNFPDIFTLKDFMSSKLKSEIKILTSGVFRLLIATII